MKRDATKYFVCPECEGDLTLAANDPATEVESGSLSCAACAKSYPIVRGVPRFIEGEHYADTFGRQWRRWSLNQHDSVNGTPTFRNRMICYSGWTPESMKG